MKILAIGDPHGDLEKIKSIPIKGIKLILLTGDLGSASLMRKMAFENIDRKKQGLKEKKFPKKQEKKAFMEAYDSSMKVVKYLAKKAPVYIIYGNVESSNAITKKLSKKIKLKLPYLTDSLNSIKNVKVINNKFVNFKGINIIGLEYFIDDIWVKNFKPDKYKKRLISARKETRKTNKFLNSFKEPVHILVCHQPPYGYLDKVKSPPAPKHWNNKHAGSKIILSFIKQKQPKYVFCGHIHEGMGNTKIKNSNVYNLGVCGFKIIDL
jgi:Icc-related predicted phosphoesterase